jgi:hypothetical protein
MLAAKPRMEFQRRRDLLIWLDAEGQYDALRTRWGKYVLYTKQVSKSLPSLSVSYELSNRNYDSELSVLHPDTLG